MGVFHFRLSGIHRNQSNERQDNARQKNIPDAWHFLCAVFDQVGYNLEIGHLRDLFRSLNCQFAYLSFFRKT
jgi:hypothetical protein